MGISIISEIPPASDQTISFDRRAPNQTMLAPSLSMRIRALDPQRQLDLAIAAPVARSRPRGVVDRSTDVAESRVPATRGDGVVGVEDVDDGRHAGQLAEGGGQGRVEG